MRSFLFFTIAALALFAGLSAAAPAPVAPVAPSPEMLRRHIENEPSAMFSKRQLAERPSRVKNTKLAARAKVSALPSPYKYNLEIINSDGSLLGYLARGPSNSEYWIYTTSKKDAVAVADPSSGSSGNLQFASSGNNMVGAFVGPNAYSNYMSAGSYNYLPLTGSTATRPGSVPVIVRNDFNSATRQRQRAETAVWQYDSSSGALNLVWVNPNRSKITMAGMVGVNYRNVFLVGDRNAFASHFNGDTYHSVTFKLTLI